MRQHIREIQEFFQRAYDNGTPEERAQMEKNWAVLDRVHKILSQPREPLPSYTQKLIDRMMNDPEGRKIFNEELDRLLGPEEGNDGNGTTPNLGS